MVFACAGVVLAQQSDRTTPSAGNASENNPSDEVIPGQYIVVFEDGVSDPRQEAREHARGYGAEILHTYEHALKGYAAKLSEEQRERVSRDPDVKYISEDRKVYAVAQNTPTGINRIEGDQSSQKSGNGSGFASNPGVAIIDTGIDIDHPDLNVKGGKNCSTGKSYDDGNGHGTHVAGSVAAKDDSVGVVGAVPGEPLYAVRVLDNRGSGSWSSVACGIDWVTANGGPNGIKVANMSLGGSGSDKGNCGNNEDALHEAICNSVKAGITYVVAAGNSNADLKGFVPAAYDEVLTVSAVADFNGEPGGGAAATCRSDVDDTAANFSNYTTTGHADEGHTIAAPGVCIRSTWKDGGYNTISGTSMASPHIAGVAALCIATSGTTLKCTDGPSDVMGDLRSDAAAQLASYGFREDPHQVTSSGSRYYGYLTYAKDY